MSLPHNCPENWSLKALKVRSLALPSGLVVFKDRSCSITFLFIFQIDLVFYGSMTLIKSDHGDIY